MQSSVVGLRLHQPCYGLAAARQCSQITASLILQRSSLNISHSCVISGAMRQALQPQLHNARTHIAKHELKLQNNCGISRVFSNLTTTHCITVMGPLSSHGITRDYCQVVTTTVADKTDWSAYSTKNTACCCSVEGDA
jgi:hypothetical protein